MVEEASLGIWAAWVLIDLGLWDGGMERFGRITGVVIPH